MFCDRRTPWGPVGTVRSAFDDILKTLQTPLQVRTPKVIGAARSLYVLVSEPRPLLAQNNILIQYRAPKRADPDQPTPLSLANAGGCNLDACACFLGSTWGGDRGLSHELLWALYR